MPSHDMVSSITMQQQRAIGTTYPLSSYTTTTVATTTTTSVIPTASSYPLSPQGVNATPTTNITDPITTAKDGTTTINKDNSNKNTTPHLRQVAGKVWVDPTLSDWPDNDYRIFVGNLDPNVTDEQLYEHFCKYPSLHQVRIIRDKKKNNTSLGYGFVSLLDPLEFAKAIREQDQSWLGGRQIRIKRSHWKDRELHERQNKQKHSNNHNKKKRH
jgi:hypothetical protein